MDKLVRCLPAEPAQDGQTFIGHKSRVSNPAFSSIATLGQVPSFASDRKLEVDLCLRNRVKSRTLKVV